MCSRPCCTSLTLLERLSGVMAEGPSPTETIGWTAHHSWPAGSCEGEKERECVCACVSVCLLVSWCVCMWVSVRVRVFVAVLHVPHTVGALEREWPKSPSQTETIGWTVPRMRTDKYLLPTYAVALKNSATKSAFAMLTPSADRARLSDSSDWLDTGCVSIRSSVLLACTIEVCRKGKKKEMNKERKKERRKKNL